MSLTPPAPGRAIVVDDNPLNLYYTGRILRAQGYETTTTDNYFAALQTLEQPGAVLLVADIRLPAGSGLELARFARERTPHVKVLLMTAYTEEEIRAKDLVLPVIRVPFTQRDLGNRLRGLFFQPGGQ